MPCPHYDIKIVQRSKRQSAVAAAAYQSGDRLFSEYDRSPTPRNRASSIQRYSCRKTPRPDTQTATLYGTPLKPWRASGTPSLPGVLSWLCRGSCHGKNKSGSCGNIARRSLSPRA